MLRYHLYVSNSRIDHHRRTVEVERLVQEAQEANANLGITGALIFSGARFAQYLEGPSDAVDALLTRIYADERHQNVTALQDGESTERQFKDWALSFAGLSFYVDRHIKPLIGSTEDLPGRDRQIEQLMRLVFSLTQSLENGR